MFLPYPIPYTQCLNKFLFSLHSNFSVISFLLESSRILIILSKSMSDERKSIDHETKRNFPFLMGMITKIVHIENSFFQDNIMVGFVHFSKFFYSLIRTNNDKRWKSSYILRRPQNFAKSPPIICPMYCQSNNWQRFRKIMWPSQNIWTLNSDPYIWPKIYAQTPELKM